MPYALAHEPRGITSQRAGPPPYWARVSPRRKVSARMTMKTLLVISLGLACLSACGEDETKPAVEGDCAAGQSFATVADPFLDQYCRTCHGAKSAAKLGDGHDFSEQDEVFEHGHAMFENLTGEGTAMPPAGFPQPTAAAKQKFLDWLECSGATGASKQ